MDKTKQTAQASGTRDTDTRQKSGTRENENYQASGTRDTDTRQKISPATFEHYLKDIRFPAQKRDLINRAKENGAPEDVIRILNQFQEKDYNSVIDVSKEFAHRE